MARGRRGALVVVVVLVVVAVGAAGAWWFLVRSDAPPAVEAEACAEGGPTPSRSAPAGTWAVASGEPTFVGYRIDEVFGGGVEFDQTAAGRTGQVTGELVLEGDGRVASVEVTADVATLESDKVRRDDYIRQKALESDTFPEATFRLTEPIAVDVDSGCVNATATGELTLHGQTRPVSLPVTATWDGESLTVEGSTEIVLADYGITTPNVAGMVSVRDRGAMELSVVFTPPG